MKRTRRSVLRTTVAATSAAGAFGTASASQSTTSDRVDYSLFNDRGLWTWIPYDLATDREGRQDLFFERAAVHRIGTLYPFYDDGGNTDDEEPSAMTNASDAAIEAFVRRCHDNGIEVHPLVGGGVAGFTAAEAYPHCEDIVAWNESHPPEESFDGVHINVENPAYGGSYGATVDGIKSDLLDRMDGFPDELTISMAYPAMWIRNLDTDRVGAVVEHRNMDYIATMIYETRVEEHLLPNWARAVAPFDTPYVVGNQINEHGAPIRTWSDADELYGTIEEYFYPDGPGDHVDCERWGGTCGQYLGTALHSFWGLFDAPEVGDLTHIGDPSRPYTTDPEADDGIPGGDEGDDDTGGDENRAPTASFELSETTAAAGDDVTADAGASSDPDGTIASYAWEFGDGTTATGVTATNAYGETGSYTVSLTVTDDEGATDSASATVTVEDGGSDDGDEDDGSSDYPAWDSSTVYESGDRVVHDGAVWEAQWWTRGDEPGASEWGPWEHVEDVDDGSDDGSSDHPEWDPDTVYTGGERVTYDGYVWEAQWWTQGDEPGSSQWGPWERV